MKSLVAAVIFALALPVFAQPELEEAPGASELPPPPSAPSTSDLNEAVDQLSNEQKSAPAAKPRHQMPTSSPVKHGHPAHHEKPKKEKKKAKKEKAAKKAAKADKKKKKKKH